MRNKFDMQLERLSEQLIFMGSLCEKAIANATKALRALQVPNLHFSEPLSHLQLLSHKGFP